MGKGGGGGADTSGLEAATKEATALQKMIYEQTREDSQPWYQAGVGGISKLSDLLGISGGSVQDRDQIYDSLIDQYTTTSTVGGNNNMMVTPDGTMIDVSNQGALSNWIEGSEYSPLNGVGQDILYASSQGDYDALSQYGFDPFSQSQETTDYDALNAAVDAQLAGQTTPEGYGSLLEAFSMDKFEEDPSYLYRQEESNKALERAMAAQGVTLGGGGYGAINPQVAKALQDQNQNMASMEYGNAYSRYNADQQNVYNKLMGISGMGQNSTGQMAQAGQNYATNTGNLTTGLASAQMNAQMANQSQPSMFGSLLGAGAQLGGSFLGTEAGAAALAGVFSDIRLKENIKLVGVENKHNIYEFDYKDGSGRYRGVMAHEVQESEPEAVMLMPNGYLAVDYDMIGLEMEKV